MAYASIKMAETTYYLDGFPSLSWSPWLQWKPWP